jgi:hypothetical protein
MPSATAIEKLEAPTELPGASVSLSPPVRDQLGPIIEMLKRRARDLYRRTQAATTRANAGVLNTRDASVLVGDLALAAFMLEEIQ